MHDETFFVIFLGTMKKTGFKWRVHEIPPYEKGDGQR
jgi:hypothetical protein